MVSLLRTPPPNWTMTSLFGAPASTVVRARTVRAMPAHRPAPRAPRNERRSSRDTSASLRSNHRLPHPCRRVYASPMRTGAAALLVISMESVALANGGPFLVREAGGDPATKGAPAPILPDLLPGREERLQVVKEELLFRFTGHPASAPIDVSAQY